jgi:hypothetical protein
MFTPATLTANAQSVTFGSILPFFNISILLGANQLLAFLAAKVKYKKAPDEYSMSLFTKLVFYI